MEIAMKFWSTRQVATLLGISVARVTKAVWLDRLQQPQKSPSGNFLWTEDDIERASWALLHRSFRRGGGDGK
jgi:hypothetical protein